MSAARLSTLSARSRPESPTRTTMTSTLPESSAVIMLRRYSTDPQLDEAAEKLTNCARTFKQYLAAIVGE